MKFEFVWPRPNPTIKSVLNPPLSQTQLSLLTILHHTILQPLLSTLSLKMEDAEECITGLCLGLGMGGHVPKKGKQKENRPVKCLDLAFELCPKGEAINLDHDKVETTDSDNSNNNNKRCRKKLRLSKDQSSMLENSFKLHSTLNPVYTYIFTFSRSNFCIYLKTYVSMCGFI